MNSERPLLGPGRDGGLTPFSPSSHEITRLICLEPLDAGGPEKSGDSGVLELWQVIRDRKMTIAALAVLGILGALLIYLIQNPVYQAGTTIEVQSLNESSLEPLGDTGGTPYTPETYLQTQARILQSASVRARVDAKMLADTAFKPWKEPDHFAPIRRWLRLPAKAAKPNARQLPPVELHVKPYENTRLIEILVDAPDPKFAANYANTMTNEYIEYQLEARWNAAQRATRFLTQQIEKLRLKLQNSENRLQAYGRNAGLLFTDDKQNVEQAKLGQIQTELSAATADRVSKQASWEIARSSPPDTVPQVLDNGRLSGYQAQLADLRRQLAEMGPSLTPEHYKVIRVQAQIKALESTFQNERANILARIRNDYDTAVRREAALKDSYARQAALVSEQSAKTIDYDILRREVDSNRKLYDELLGRVQGAGLASALHASNIRIVDPAEPPRFPYKPNLIKSIALGLFTGLLLGVGLVLAGEHVNRSLKSPGETPFHLKVPELGVIPDKGSVLEKSRDGSPRLLPLRTGLAGEGDHVELVTWRNRPSVLAESFRSTLASILVTEHNGQRPRVIVITSPGRGEGKSTTVSNLGIALAEINQKVLLLDADMRKPHLHEVFNAPNSWGLSDLLRERTSLKDMPLEALARETEVNGLYILPSGTGTVSIANLLYSNRTAELLQRLRQEFDTVLIDTPPMLYISDARVLGRLADGAILVVRAGKTTRDAALGAKQRLVDDRIPVMGTILNGWDSKAKTRYGYYTYAAGVSGEG